MTYFKSLFLYKCFFLICFLHFVAHGETLIIQSSDQHSSYHRLPQFLKSIGILSERFKSQYPEGQLVLVINGDFSSYDSYWTKEDQGNFGYEILSQLASKYLVFYTFGNHDSFDWENSQLFLDQMKLLKQAGVHLIVANAFFHPEYQNLFTPFVDVPLSQNEVIRFTGFTLPYSKKSRFTNSESEPVVITDNLHIEERSLKIIEKADKNPRVNSLVLSMHVGSKKMKNIVSNLEPEDKEKLRIVFTAHDHRRLLDKSGPTHIINSGSHFDFSMVILDDQGQVVSTEFFDQSSQEEISGQIQKTSLEAQLIGRAGKHIGLTIASTGNEEFYNRFVNNSDKASLSECARVVRELF